MNCTKNRNYWIYLHSNPKLTDKNLLKLMTLYPDPIQIFNKPDIYREIFPNSNIEGEVFYPPSSADLKAISEMLNTSQIQFLLPSDPQYPSRLHNSPYKVPILYYKGTLLPQDFHSLAVVGTRRPSPYGLQVCQKLVQSLTQKNITLVSGLALGIDQCCHHHCIQHQVRTLAILGQGLAAPFAGSLDQWVNKISKNGAVLSQFYPMQAPAPYLFPKRNQVITGMTAATIVIECPKKSGSLITSELCAAEGKPVFTVPSDIFRASSVGSNMLLAEGALPLLNHSQLLDIFFKVNHNEKSINLNEDKTSTTASPDSHSCDSDISNLLGYDPISLEDLCEKLNQPAQEVLAILTELELEGKAKTLSGNFFCKSIP
jgi:DNA processing protein